LSAYPASTAAREAPTAESQLRSRKKREDVPAPSTSAKGSRTLLKFSRLFSARPPETTLPADDRSGLDETVNSSEMYLVDADVSVLLDLPPRQSGHTVGTGSLHFLH
jgi:hypothetical protein